MYIIMSIYNLFNKQIGQKIFYLSTSLIRGIPLVVYKTIQLPLAKYNNKYVLVSKKELITMKNKLPFVERVIGQALSDFPYNQFSEEEVFNLTFYHIKHKDVAALFSRIENDSWSKVVENDSNTKTRGCLL